MTEPLLLDPWRFPTARARFEECMVFVESGGICFIVWSDDRQRREVLMALKARSRAVYLDCEAYPSIKQFLRAIAKAAGISPDGCECEIEERILEYVGDRPVILDRADCLTSKQLDVLLDFRHRNSWLLACSAGNALERRVLGSTNFEGRYAMLRNLNSQ